MNTVIESLKGAVGYPVPDRVLADVASIRGLALEDEATESVLTSTSYMLAKADVMRWVSFAPNVHQADLSYDLLYSDREQMRKLANAIYGDLGDGNYIPEVKTKFGYKGSRL
ncbi:MAG: hypothetical protein LBB90_08880 [Tannerella sp.]|jgi:hypothetical protein|nr:hypothetical protein [Tannerella sp.]